MCDTFILFTKDRYVETDEKQSIMRCKVWFKYDVLSHTTGHAIVEYQKLLPTISQPSTILQVHFIYNAIKGAEVAMKNGHIQHRKTGSLVSKIA